jgi:hypothetical protein
MLKFWRNWRKWEGKLVQKRKKVKGYSFRPGKDALADAMSMSAEEKLAWLKQAGSFVNHFVSLRKLAVWEKCRKQDKS